jgi:tetratricopeptide (TPR) repeat protein
MSQERYQDQLAAAEAAADCARSAGDDRLFAEAEVWRGCALNQLGRWEEGRSAQEAAIPLCETANDLSSLSHALNDVAFAHEAAGRFDRSRFYKQRALEVAERLGDPTGIANMAFRCGQLAFLQGAWEDARSYYLRALDLVNVLDGSAITPYPHFGLARLALVEGSIEEAMHHARECRSRAESVADRQAIQAAAALLAECELRLGDPVSARRRLGELEPGEDGLALYNVAPIVAEVYLAAGDRPQARTWAERSVARAGSSQNRVDLVDALCARASVLEADDPVAALSDLDEALSLARAIGYQPGETRAVDRRNKIEGTQVTRPARR